MERKPDSANGISKVRRISYYITKKLGKSQEVNENSKKAMKRQFDKKRRNP